MNTQSRAPRDWLQILTNFGVILGLLLLLYELNQSRELVQAQVVDGVYNAGVTRNLALLGENPQVAIAKSVFYPEQVSEAEAVVLVQFYTSLEVSWLRNKDERGLGYFERGFEEVVASEAYYLNTVPGRKWWSVIREFTDPEIARIVDAELSTVSVETNRDVLSSIVGSKGLQYAPNG